MVDHSEPGQILPGDKSHHLVVVIAHKHVSLRENVRHIDFVNTTTLTIPKDRNLLKI